MPSPDPRPPSYSPSPPLHLLILLSPLSFFSLLPKILPFLTSSTSVLSSLLSLCLFHWFRVSLFPFYLFLPLCILLPTLFPFSSMRSSCPHVLLSPPSCPPFPHCSLMLPFSCIATHPLLYSILRPFSFYSVPFHPRHVYLRLLLLS